MIYVASRTKHAHIWRKCRDVGGYPIISTWIDESEPGQTENMGVLWFKIMEEIKKCDRLVLFVRLGDLPLKGVLVEAGAAIALGKNVYVYAEGFTDIDYRNQLGSWVNHHQVFRVNSLFAALTGNSFAKAGSFNK